jgi:hypothetical protein
MGINTATLKFKNDLVALINNSGLPICNVEMILSNTLSVVQAELRKSIELEKKKEQEVESDG